MSKKHPDRAEDIMERRVESLAASAELHEAVRVLLKRGYSGAPVTEADGTLLGMFSEHDSLKVLGDAVYQGWPSGTVAEHMTKDAESVAPEEGLMELVRRFTAGRHHSLPVVRDGKVVGLVTRGALMRALDRMLDREGPKTTYALIGERRG